MDQSQVGPTSYPTPSTGAGIHDEVSGYTHSSVSTPWLTCGLVFQTDRYSDEDSDDEEEEDHHGNSHHYTNDDSSVRPTRACKEGEEEGEGDG